MSQCPKCTKDKLCKKCQKAIDEFLDNYGEVSMSDKNKESPGV
jgi:hypothetical protein